MTTWTVEYPLGITGLTITGTAFRDASGDAAGVVLSFTENTTRTGYYTATTTSLTAGLAWFKIGGDVVDSMFATVPASGSFKLNTYQFSTLATEANATANTNTIVAAISSASGSGSNTITVTVNDGTNVLQGARVTAKLNGTLAATATTNVSGIASLYLNNGTYTYSVTLAGYNGTGGTLVVSADASVTYSITAMSITPSTPPEATGWLTCVDENGDAVAGVLHTVTLVGQPVTSTGSSLSRTPRTAQSDSSGLVQFPGLVSGMEYEIQRGNGTGKRFTADTVTFQLPTCSS